MKYTTEQLIELAKEADKEDPIDWGGLPLDTDKSYQILASQVLEIYDDASLSDDKEAVLLATILHLIAQNFALNLQIPGNNIHK